MKRIIYLSSSSYFLKEDKIIELYEHCKKYNLENEITGLFLYLDQDILQVIEGSVKEVDKLFCKIKKDSRHSSIIKLAEESIEKRYFPKWHMGFYILGYHEIQKMANFKGFNREFLQKSDSVNLRIFIESFLNNHPEPKFFQ